MCCNMQWCWNLNWLHHADMHQYIWWGLARIAAIRTDIKCKGSARLNGPEKNMWLAWLDVTTGLLNIEYVRIVTTCRHYKMMQDCDVIKHNCAGFLTP